MRSHQKHLFELPDEVTYLNGAYMAPQLKTVTEVGITNMRRKHRPYEITSEDFFTQRVQLKKAFATLIHAKDPQNVAIIPSTSYGIANAAQNITLHEGDEILVVDEQFPSNIYIWQRLAKKHKAQIKVVKAPLDFKHRGALWNEAILAAITSKTTVVTMAHVHWADGTLFDLRRIREKTREKGALLIIDGSQSVGALPFSVDELDPDALICCGYKWLMGPYALGVAYYGEAFMNGTPIEDGWMNRKHSEDFTQLTNYQSDYKPKAERYSVGESSNFVLVPMLTKAIEQLIQWQPENIQSYCKQISLDTLNQLRASGCFIEDENYRAQHLFGVYLPQKMDLEALKRRLLEKQIYISMRGKAIRISCNMYNTTADFEKLLSCF